MTTTPTALAHTRPTGRAHTTSRQAIRQVFGPRATDAECIGAQESTGTPGYFNPRAVGDAGERGIFQIHPIHFGQLVGHGVRRFRIVADRLFDPFNNARVAFEMSGGGRYWRPAWNATAGKCGLR